MLFGGSKTTIGERSDSIVHRRSIPRYRNRSSFRLVIQVLFIATIVIVIHLPNVINGFATINTINRPSNRVSSLCRIDDYRSGRPNQQQQQQQDSRIYVPERSLIQIPSDKVQRQTILHSTTAGNSVAVVDNDDDDSGGVESYTSKSNSKMMGQLLALYKFTRPHTIRGTILASICGTVRALRDTPYWWTIGSTGSSVAATAAAATAMTTGGIWNIFRNMLPRALIGMVALLFGNAFIVGINQIYDQSIDKMNKPFLPIVSGEMNTTTAWVFVILSAILGPILVYNNFPTILFQLYTFGLFLGLIYSVPPIRTKQNPILAGLTIACVRGLLLNFGIYYAVKDTFVRNSFTWSPHVSFIARFMTIFASIIAITKDLPDLEGDKANQIETFVTKFGIANIAKGATGLLFGNYIHAIITGVVQYTIFAPLPMIGGHVVLASMLLYRYKQLQPNSMASVKRFYKHIWDLFYLEYVLYTII